jgi:hypothetical protein
MSAQSSRWFLLCVSLVAFSAIEARADIAYTTEGSTYTQNFDSLANTGTPAWSNDTTIPGWFARYILNPQPSTYSANNGTGASGLSSLGSTASNERALGATAVNANAASGSAEAVQYGVLFTNGTGALLTDFTLSFTGEQWRSANTTAQTLTFGYKIGPTVAITESGFTSVGALTFTSPILTNTGALDGNATGNKVALSTTVSGISWPSGQQLFLRWNDGNESGNDHSLAIDSVSFSAVPEPAAVLFGCLACAGIGMGVCGRRLKAWWKS